MSLSKLPLIVLVIAVAVSGAQVILHNLNSAGDGMKLAGSNGIAASNDPITGGPAVGSVAPDFKLPTVSGQTLSLSSFRGQPVILGFFCGCDRCHAAALKTAAKQRQGYLKNFVAVVAMDPAGVAAFTQATGIRGTMFVDPSDLTSERYDSDFCPRLWKLGSDGLIRYGSRGALEGAEADSAIATLAA